MEAEVRGASMYLLATTIVKTRSEGGELGGGDIRFVEIGKRLVRRGVSVTVVTTAAGIETMRELGLAAAAEVLRTGWLRKAGLLVAYAVNGLAATMKTVRLHPRTCLYSTSDYLPDVIPAYFFKMRFPSGTWVQVVHHLMPHPSRRAGNGLRNRLSYYGQRMSLALIRRKADMVIVVNPLTKVRLVDLGFADSKVKVSPNGIERSFFREITPAVDNSYDAAFLGRIHPSKGIFELVDIWYEVCKRRGPSTLAIIGTGDQRVKAELDRRIRLRGLQAQVETRGFLPSREAFATIKSARVFAFPSHEEGFGLSVCEAMACGLPVVAWDLDVFQALFPSGVVRIPEGDVGAFADAVVRLLDDPDWHRQLKGQASAIADQYDWEDVAEREFQILEGVAFRGLQHAG